MIISSVFGLPSHSKGRRRHRSPRTGLPTARARTRTLTLASIGLWILIWPLTSSAQVPPAPSEPSRPTISLPSTLNSNTASTPAPAAPPSANPVGSVVSAPTGYQLSANDSIAVEVFGEDDLKTAARLNGEGNVSLPLIGSVHLAGLTLTQATARVTELYARDYLVNPRVNVTLLGYAKRRFTVLGQVNRPGSYEMPETSPGGIDLLEAIAMAGGYTRIAAPERVSVRRHAGEPGEKILRVDAKRLARGDGGSFRVEAGDAITVGESIF
jgi:protein involved in polysaccharide export with SLBB domain